MKNQRARAMENSNMWRAANLARRICKICGILDEIQKWIQICVARTAYNVLVLVLVTIFSIVNTFSFSLFFKYLTFNICWCRTGFHLVQSDADVPSRSSGCYCQWFVQLPSFSSKICICRFEHDDLRGLCLCHAPCIFFFVFHSK